MITQKKYFIFPYAGGSSLSFLRWHKYFKENELFLVEYKGHGMRRGEQFDDSIETMAEDAVNQLLKANFQTGDILFGHSMGGMIAWVANNILALKYGINPGTIIISNCKPPDCFKQVKHFETDDDLWKYMLDFNHVKTNDSQKIREWIIPILKHDYSVIRRFENSYKGVQISTPMKIFCGVNDLLVGIKDMEGWNKYLTEDAEMILFPGDHFYFEQDNIFPQVIKYLRDL